MIQPGILKSDVLIGLGVDGPIIGGGGGRGAYKAVVYGI